ncbi:translation initiation factor IF-2 subunit beta [Candidatus Woesearchaeota archaeon]|nr:MAG: translation initiation factor IF-2 subunit beta [Candidatus Woesearchaeota archaeon]
MNYEELLKKAKKELPETDHSGERFEVPKVKGHIQGNKTIISNFLDISKIIRRKPEHILKYILKELAAPGEITNNQLIIGTKVPSSKVNEKLLNYVDTYVICRTCGKPDTKLSKDNNIILMTCQACGARQTVQSKI